MTYLLSHLLNGLLVLGRIAYRGDPDGPHAGKWVPMESGVSVIDETPNRLAIFFDGIRVH